MDGPERTVLLGQVTEDSVPSVPTGVVRVYVCSVGSDTTQERNALVTKVYPRVREYCRERYGLEFQAVDLRWGEADEVYPADHSNLTFYQKEIQKCQDLSEGPNFLLIVGQKLGRCSVPASIRDEEYRHIRHALKRHKGRQTRNAPLLDDWYELNENTLPNTYVLKSISSYIPEYTQNNDSVRKEGQDKWIETERELRRLLDKGAEWCHVDGVFDLGTRNKYSLSDLEVEAQRGIENTEKRGGKCLVIYRDIIDLKNYTNEASASTYTELVYNERKDCLEIDNTCQNRITNMKNRLDAFLPSSNKTTFDVLWRYEDVISPELHKEYIDNLCTAVRDGLIRLTDDAAKGRHGLHGSETYLEALQHWVRCRAVAANHIGREDIMNSINQYLKGESGKPLVVYGISGVGKTSVMSKVAFQAQNLFPRPVITITRYIGYTPQSTNLRQLLQSICCQLTIALDGDQRNIPTDCTDLVRCFHELIETVPENYQLLIFLDAISQIRPDFNAHALTWLPTSLKANVRVVISVRTGKEGLLTRLQDHTIQDEKYFLEINTLSLEAAESLLAYYLDKSYCCITARQGVCVKQMLEKCSLPMYVKILASFICNKWLSSTSVTPNSLPANLEEAVAGIFSQLEKRFGSVTIARSMGYIIASESGLSDCELEDILSLDDVVVNEVYGNRPPIIHRIPSSRWLQIKDSFSPFLASKERDGVTVNFLSHESFSEFIKKSYLSDEGVVKEMHSLLADYFLGRWAVIPKPILPSHSDNGVLAFPNGTKGLRFVPTQPHTFTGHSGVTNYNRRKYDQVPRHLYISDRLNELNELVLFNYEWLYNKTKALSLQQIMLDLSLNPSKETTLVSECLRASQSIIEKDINNLAAELTGHLLPHFQSYPNIRELIRRCDRHGSKHNALVPVFPYNNSTGSSLGYVVDTVSIIHDCLFSHDGKTLLVKGKDNPNIFSCDVVSGQTKDTLITSTGSLHITPNGKYFLVVDHVTEKSVKLHRGDNGRFIGQLVMLNHINLKGKEKCHVGSVCVSNHRVCIVVTTDKSCLCIAEIPSCTFLQIVELDSRSTICRMTPDASHVFCNSGNYLLTYNVITRDHTCTTPLPYCPNSMVFTHDGRRCYLSNEFENKVLVVHFQNGNVELAYKAVVENWMTDDSIQELLVSPDDKTIGIRGLDNLLLYDRAKEEVTAHFPRPSEVLHEFKLPRSSYEEMVFTQMAFSGDSRYLYGTIFRNIHMWDISNGKLITTIQAPPGVITRLLVSKYGQLFTLLHGYHSIQAWNMKDIVNKVDPMDRLSDEITDIKFTPDQSMAFVRCSSGEELAVVEMQYGTIMDLLTHESKVEDFAITPSGSHVLVSTTPKWSNCAVKLWDLENRSIISEFGNAPGFCVPFHFGNSVLSVCQQDIGLKAPYQITRFNVYPQKLQTSTIDFHTPFILSRPFVTHDDQHLIMLTADNYVGSKGTYETPIVTVIDLATDSVKRFSPESFHDISNVVAILDVRECPMDPCVVVIIYMTNSDLEYTTEEAQIINDHIFPSYGILVLDINDGTVKVMCEPFMESRLSIDNSLLLAKDFSFAVDASSHIFDCTKMSYTGKLPSLENSHRLLALDGRVFTYSSGSTINVIRLRDMKAIAKCETHSVVSCIALCPDDRTLLIGCEDGTLLSYVIIDPDHDDSDFIIANLPSRHMGSTYSRRSSRAWDRVNYEQHVPAYSRPPSAKSTGPNQKELLERVNPVPRIRPKSDTFLYMNNKSATCAVM